MALPADQEYTQLKPRVGKAAKVTNYQKIPWFGAYLRNRHARISPLGFLSLSMMRRSLEEPPSACIRNRTQRWTVNNGGRLPVLCFVPRRSIRSSLTRFSARPFCASTTTSPSSSPLTPQPGKRCAPSESKPPWLTDCVLLVLNLAFLCV